MLFSIYDVFYSRCFHQHASAGILTIFRVMLLLEEHKRTNLVNCVTTPTKFGVCIHVIISPWRWTECQPKHVGENVVNKIRHKYWSAHVGYLHILDLINVWKMEHIRIWKLYLWISLQSKWACCIPESPLWKKRFPQNTVWIPLWCSNWWLKMHVNIY